MTNVVGVASLGLWRCECGHVNLDRAQCEKCGAAPLVAPNAAPDEAPSAMRVLWEQSKATEDLRWQAARAETIAAQTMAKEAKRMAEAPRKARRGSTRTVIAIIVLNLVLQLVVLAISRGNALGVREELELSLGTAVMLYGAVAVWVGMRSETLGVVAVWLVGHPARAVIEGVAIGGAVASALSLAGRAATGHPVLDPIAGLLAGQRWEVLALGLVVIAGIAPVVEEIVFRGFLAESFRTRGARFAVGVSAIAFAVAHLRVAQLYYFALMGVGFGVLYLRRGLLGSISAHAAFNGSLVAFAVLASHGPARTTQVDGLSLRVPASWHQIQLKSGGDLGLIGPNGAQLVVTHVDLPPSSQFTLDAFAAALTTAAVSRPNVAIDQHSLAMGQLPIGRVLRFNGTVKGHPDQSTILLVGSQAISVDFLPEGSDQATHDVQAMLASLAPIGSKPTAAPATAATADPRQFVLLDSDLPAGFTTARLPQFVPGTTPSVPPQCVNTLVTDPSAHYASGYAFEVQANGADHGQVFSDTYVLGSPAAAASVHAFDQAPVYAQCLKDSMVDFVRQNFPTGAGGVVTSSRVTRVATPLPLPGEEFLVQVAYRYSGSTGVDTERVIHLYRGTMAGRVQIGYCTCASFPDDAVTQAATVQLAAHLIVATKP